MDQIQDHCILFFILAFFCSMYSLCATFYENYYFICLPKYVRKVDMHLTSFLLMHAGVFNNIIFSFFYINSWINYELMTYKPWLLFFLFTNWKLNTYRSMVEWSQSWSKKQMKFGSIFILLIFWSHIEIYLYAFNPKIN